MLLRKYSPRNGIEILKSIIHLRQIQLIKSFQSAAVGDAIYDHDWHNADLEYKKMLVEIIIRSQKEANIRAPTFPPTSYETFMGVMSTSYKFLTVLRQWLNR